MRNRTWYGVTIQVRRGTKAELDGITLAAGELGFTTDDEKELFVGDGSNNLLIGRVLEDTLANIPTSYEAGRLFYATDTKELFVDTGAAWEEILSDISGTEDNLISIDANGKPQDANVAVDDAGTTTSDLWTANKIQTEIDNAIDGRSWKQPVVCIGLVGNGAASTIEGLSPSAGDAYVVTTADGAGDLSTAVVGDIWEYSGSAWAKIVSAAAGFVPADTRAALSTATALIAPYTDATDDGKIDAFSGTSNTGATTSDAANGNAVVVDEGVYDNNQYAFDGTVPTGSWNLINQGGGLTAGNGIDITSSIVSVDADSETGGDTQPVSVGANGVGVDISAIAGTGIEADGSANLRLATQGNGIAGGNGSTLSVDADSETGGDTQPVSVGANGVGVDISAIAGTGIEADGSANLRLATQGNGIAGGNGSTLSVDADDTTGATVAPVAVGADGVGVTVDNDTIKHTAGEIYVATVDGGSFA